MTDSIAPDRIGIEAAESVARAHRAPSDVRTSRTRFIGSNMDPTIYPV
jgi:hypothetical protein